MWSARRDLGVWGFKISGVSWTCNQSEDEGNMRELCMFVEKVE